VPERFVDAAAVSTRDPAEAGRRLLAAGIPALGALPALAGTIGSIPLAALPPAVTRLRTRARWLSRALVVMSTIGLLALLAARIVIPTRHERLVVPLIALAGVMVALSFALSLYMVACAGVSGTWRSTFSIDPSPSEINRERPGSAVGPAGPAQVDR
jgi:hypothetical protein